jgi:hypothetical protein
MATQKSSFEPPAICRTPTLTMIKAVVGALVDRRIIPAEACSERYLEVWEAAEAGLRAALDAAPWCEHGVADGEFCGPCNQTYKRARAEHDGGEDDA